MNKPSAPLPHHLVAFVDDVKNFFGHKINDFALQLSNRIPAIASKQCAPESRIILIGHELPNENFVNLPDEQLPSQ